MKPQPFPIFALLTGLIIGVVGGLGYAWFLNPVQLVNVAPSQLPTEDRQAYILLISQAYMQDRRLDKAQARLQALGIREMGQVVAQQADDALSRAADQREIAALTALAQALGANPLAAEIFSSTTQPTRLPNDGSPTATFESMASITPTLNAPTITPTHLIPTSTPTPIRIVETDFNLIDLSAARCDADSTPGRIEIYVEDSDGAGIPGLEIQIVWEGQTDRFFTGLKPEIDPGYADFQMEPNKVYTISLVGLAEAVQGINSAPCAETGLMPSYELLFAPASVLDFEDQP